MDPPVSCLSITRNAALAKFHAPLRFVSITSSQSFSFMRRIRLSRVTPALFTRKSIRPKVFFHLLDHLRSSFSVCHIALTCERANSKTLQFFGQRLSGFGALCIVESYVSAMACEFERDGSSDSTRGAGNDCSTSGKWFLIRHESSREVSLNIFNHTVASAGVHALGRGIYSFSDFKYSRNSGARSLR